MAVDRLSVTVPSEIGAALRALANQRGETVSAIITEAITHQVRLAALDKLLAESERRFGKLDESEVAAAEAELLAAAKKARRPRRR